MNSKRCNIYNIYIYIYYNNEHFVTDYFIATTYFKGLELV